MSDRIAQVRPKRRRWTSFLKWSVAVFSVGVLLLSLTSYVFHSFEFYRDDNPLAAHSEMTIGGRNGDVLFSYVLMEFEPDPANPPKVGRRFFGVRRVYPIDWYRNVRDRVPRYFYFRAEDGGRARTQLEPGRIVRMKSIDVGIRREVIAAAATLASAIFTAKWLLKTRRVRSGRSGFEVVVNATSVESNSSETIGD